MSWRNPKELAQRGTLDSMTSAMTVWSQVVGNHRIEMWTNVEDVIS